MCQDPNKSEPYPEAQMKSQWPRTFSYLTNFRDPLLSRSSKSIRELAERTAFYAMYATIRNQIFELVSTVLVLGWNLGYFGRNRVRRSQVIQEKQGKEPSSTILENSFLFGWSRLQSHCEV
jgi:hypothetical protein